MFSAFGIAGFRGASFSHQSSCYLVETRARVIIFDIAAFESDNRLQRRSSSFLRHSPDLPHISSNKEHGGLMSWPENFYEARQHEENSEAVDQQKANSLSARAMQLSIYGSMVCSVYLYYFLLSSNLMEWNNHVIIQFNFRSSFTSNTK